MGKSYTKGKTGNTSRRSNYHTTIHLCSAYFKIKELDFKLSMKLCIVMSKLSPIDIFHIQSLQKSKIAIK